jgi:hypothetical protein
MIKSYLEIKRKVSEWEERQLMLDKKLGAWKRGKGRRAFYLDWKRIETNIALKP